MIKKLRNLPYAPKWEQVPKCRARGAGKERRTLYVPPHIFLALGTALKLSAAITGFN
jgi:hypothetical protein